MNPSPGKIYLSDQRGLSETEIARRYFTFNFESYQNEFKVPFARLNALNDEMLAAGQSLHQAVAYDAQILIIPITGSVIVKSEILAKEVDVEEIVILDLPAGTTFDLLNPYPDNWINFLQIWINPREPITYPSIEAFGFNLESHKNKLFRIAGPIENSFKLSIGLFDGRQEDVYSTNGSAWAFFAFVLSGAFEMQGRLLHERDGLALWDANEIDVEALSNHAIILALEFPD